MFELFLELTFWPWIIIIADISILLICTKIERYLFGNIIFITGYIIFDYLNNWRISLFIIHEPMHLLLWGILYIIIGVIWSIIKFYFTILKLKENFYEERNEWINGNKQWTREEAIHHWNEDGVKSRKIPKFENYINDIIWSIGYWPISIIYSLGFDIIHNLFKFIYNNISGIYKTMFDKFVRNLN